MNIFEKNSILDKYFETELPISKFSNESLIDKDYIIIDKINDSIDNKYSNYKSSNFPSCFVINNEDLSARKKSSPGRKNSAGWRKQSETDRKNNSGCVNHSVVKEMEFKIINDSFNEMGKEKFKNEISICSREININLENKTNDVTARFSLILNLMKKNKKKNKRNNLNVLMKVNDKLKIDMNIPLWFINCTKSLESESDIIFGPFSSNQLIKFYEWKNINENTELRINSEINVDFFDIKSKDFRIKNISKIFSLKEKNDNKENCNQDYQYSYNDYEDNYSIYDSYYTNMNENSNVILKNNIQSNQNYNCKDEYYYDMSMNKKNYRKS